MTSSWESSHRWYDSIVGEKGHYFHQQVVLPRSLQLLRLQSGDSLLDLGCGQGVLSRAIPPHVSYTGIDLSPSLIQEAKRRSRHTFIVADITEPIQLKKQFSHAAMILVVQNLEDHEKAFQTAAHHLQAGGHFLIVMNHPCFRIPRQSSWGIDEAKKLQYRRIDRYMEPLKIPLQTNPSQGEASPTTWAFHRPLSTYLHSLIQAGLTLETVEEWLSDKRSTGNTASRENRSRKEFPLFLTLLATKRECRLKKPISRQFLETNSSKISG